MRRTSSERGAAAVEFALVAPLLILLVLGIFEASRLYNVQVSLTGAAREGARAAAIGDADPVAVTRTAAPSLDPARLNVTAPASCPAGDDAVVTATYHVDFIGGLFGSGIDLRGKGVMRCGG